MGLLRYGVALGLAVATVGPAGAGPREADVVRVVDGVTLETARGETVRLAGIDLFAVPGASGERHRSEAAAFTEGRLAGRTVRLELDRAAEDREGRLLAYVWTESVLLNEALLLAGLAEVRARPPNLRHYERLARAQQKAVRERRGAWGDPEVMGAYAWRPGGVVGREVMPIFYHPTDPELARLPYGERFVYFAGPAEARRHGLAPSPGYSHRVEQERRRLVGDRLIPGIPSEVRREAEVPPRAGAAASTIASVSGPEVFGLEDGTLVRLDGIEVVREGRELVRSWRGREVVYTVSGPPLLGVLPVVLWVDGSLAQTTLIAEGGARLGATAGRAFDQETYEKLARLETAAKRARLGAWREAAPGWGSTYVAIVPATPPLSGAGAGEGTPREKAPHPDESAPGPRPSAPSLFFAGRPVFTFRFLALPEPFVVREIPLAPGGC